MIEKLGVEMVDITCLYDVAVAKTHGGGTEMQVQIEFVDKVKTIAPRAEMGDVFAVAKIQLVEGFVVFWREKCSDEGQCGFVADGDG